MSRDRGSENIFADLALPNSKQEGTQAQMSALMRCRLVSVSVERSMEFLTILGQDVEVTVKPSRARATGHMSVVVQPG
jgi:hypothetical protein